MAGFGSRNAARQKRKVCWSSRERQIFVSGVIILFLWSPFNNSLGQQHRPRDVSSKNVSTICPSIDIRNTLDTFHELKGCTVVEGFVQILLFDNFNESSFANITFPELTEITDYLLLYRVNGLRSLGHIFPNLAVIRGQTLFFSYALVIFQMSSLQEVALHSLTDITRGLVRIDKNPSLCFVNSIDWDLITHEDGENYVRSLKPENECPLCPGDETLATSDNSQQCPNSTRVENFKKHLCWNRQHCQKVCKPHCKSCNAKGQCCDSKCLGGCSIDKTDECVVCRNFTMGTGKDRKCLTRCPDNFYAYLGRRCVKKEECIAMKRPIEMQSGLREDYNYKIFEDTCVLTCPSNYMPEEGNNTCVKCEKGKCKKDCPGTNVDNLTAAQQLRGCTRITGSLEIQIRGGRNIVNELEENLNMIERIDGYLKIVRSFSLVSLNFLKNLRVIGGDPLDSGKNAFVVLDNQNLLEIWDWTNRTLEITHGKLFFHFNPKLCLSKIETLRIKANLPNVTDEEVAPASNGDNIACDVSKMEVHVISVTSLAAVLQWNPYEIDDQRKLLGYVIYSIEAPYRNVTLYDGRDACGGDGWRVDDVGVQEYDISHYYLLPQLKPYTQYAFYVKTSAVATYQKGAQSDIQYLRTLPDEPSKPRNLHVNSNGSDSFIITWNPPINPNGKLTHYIVSGEQQTDSSNFERNYCDDPPTIELKPIPESKPPDNNTCVCNHDNKVTGSKLKDENERLEQINFEDALHNVVYVKRETETRTKRNVDAAQFPANATNSKPISGINAVKNVTRNDTGTWVSFSFDVIGETQFHINNLQHFTSYNIMVRACREQEVPDEPTNACSATTTTNERTRRKEGADDVTKIMVANQSVDMVTVSWEAPDYPNGIIVSYSIEYKKNGPEDVKSTVACIPRKEFSSSGSIYYIFKELPPGNYSVRVRGNTIHSSGNYSPYVYFYISQPTSGYAVYITSIIMFPLVVALVVGAWYVRTKKKNDARDMKLIASVNPEYVSSVYVPDEWEVPRKKIELAKELGQGSFGMVYEGVVKDIRGKAQIRCAIKTVNEHATNRERIEFLNEASVMKAFDTAHVVRLLGVVSQGQPTLVIMELMANGDLKTYLRSHRPDVDRPKPPPTLTRILQMAIEIADGMAYLAAKKFVHRDLAARNCMVAEDLTVKIGDFGMTRDIYETDYYRKGTKGLLPVRWMAPESLKDGVFTSSSDVWSYGVVLWEMATLASQPYQGLSNDQVLRYVIDGGVMQRPENCPDKLYTLMTCCWQHKPSKRPNFLELCALLLENANSIFAQVSFYHSAAGVEARNTRPTPSPSQDDSGTPLGVPGVEDHLDNLSANSDEDSEQFSLIVANGYASGAPPNGTAPS